MDYCYFNFNPIDYRPESGSIYHSNQAFLAPLRSLPFGGLFLIDLSQQ